MYSEFHQFSRSFLATMSNSEICLNIKQDATARKDFNISSLESAANVFQDHVSPSEDQELDDDKEDNNIVICTTEKKLEQKPFISLGQCSSSDIDYDDIDGFRTPTSLDHKIPVIMHCPPPPPRKVIPSRKRKLASPRISRPRKLLLDLSKEVDSMFPQALQRDIGQKMKKARKDDDAPTRSIY